jgi:FkbM family methyltransferase
MIYNYLEQHFSNSTDLCIFEVGAHIGTDTIQLAKYTEHGRLVCFEPDPRNIISLRNLQREVKFDLVETAVGKELGDIIFYQSFGKKPGVPREITDFSSAKIPKGVKKKFPWARFKKIIVPATTLDYYCERENISAIDLLWVDIQGGELDLVFGAQEALQKTSLFYFECIHSPQSRFYIGQPDFESIRDALPSPDGWSVELFSFTDILMKRST